MQQTKAQRCVVECVMALERMTFVIAEPTEQDPIENLPQAVHRALVELDGSGGGFLLLAADDGFVRESAAALLGVEPEEVDADEQGQVVVNELANVLGGHVIHEFGGEDVPWRISLPTVADENVVLQRIERARQDGFATVVAADLDVMLIAAVVPGLD